MAKIIERNSPIPISQSQTFTTAVDNQPTVEIVVVQGERELASANKILGRFMLTGIDPAPGGEPAIKVTFGVTVDGTLSVSAKDERSGSTKEIVVEGASTLSKEEVESMLESAEKSASQDKEDLRKTLLMARALAAPEKLRGVKDPDRESEREGLLRNLENARRATDVPLVEEILVRLCRMYPQLGILPESFLSERS